MQMRWQLRPEKKASLWSEMVGHFLCSADTKLCPIEYHVFKGLHIRCHVEKLQNQKERNQNVKNAYAWCLSDNHLGYHAKQALDFFVADKGRAKNLNQ